MMIHSVPDLTDENKVLTRELEQLKLEFLELFTQHKEMVEQDSVILTSLYLEKLGRLQLELLEKRTEAARLKMKMNLIQSAINRSERPDLIAIENELNKRLKDYYAQIAAQSAALDEAKEILSHLISEEDTLKLKETFRVLCKRLHPDLNPNQTEEEKDLFIKVKAAYDLQKLSDLQHILLYLDDSGNEKPASIPCHEKRDRIESLKNNIQALKVKIAQLDQSFPFSMKELIFNEEHIALKQEELRDQIKTFEAEIEKYQNIISIMTDE